MRKPVDKPCQCCGLIMLGVDPLRRLCDECRIIDGTEKRREQRRRKQAMLREVDAGIMPEEPRTVKISPKQPHKSLAQVVREANAAGMSYGQYVAQMRNGGRR